LERIDAAARLLGFILQLLGGGMCTLGTSNIIQQIVKVDLDLPKRPWYLARRSWNHTVIQRVKSGGMLLKGFTNCHGDRATYGWFHGI